MLFCYAIMIVNITIVIVLIVVIENVIMLSVIATSNANICRTTRLGLVRLD